MQPRWVESNLCSLDRLEDEFETKSDYDDFLELREELVMNLVLRTDVPGTNRKLRDYAVANGLKVDSNDATTESEKKAIRKKDVDPTLADPSGLVKGLKKKAIREAEAPYDPFMGMPRSKDYYEVKDSYVARARGKPAEAIITAGYDFRQYMDECLLRAFAGLGVFIEDEMATKNNTAVPAPDIGSSRVLDDGYILKNKP